ncbi:hypothetical protein RSOLAG1IB_08460 [Rhizoctonia solani AG-1 IB]|uniref:Uncharacterized protein n=1 Tax=Thanatephorus cucumeris (strain AG1-IB / isolate 7/3/14) TaxID=1108050 RepID=A0A0B7FM09_THACB|nr:hypothetical protein RSOLAG1IB_08460 [Rhizoctonia solani AG-1 IB]
MKLLFDHVEELTPEVKLGHLSWIPYESRTASHTKIALTYGHFVEEHDASNFASKPLYNLAATVVRQGLWLQIISKGRVGWCVIWPKTARDRQETGEPERGSHSLDAWPILDYHGT